MLLPLLMQVRMLWRDTHDGARPFEDVSEHRKRVAEELDAKARAALKMRETIRRAMEGPLPEPVARAVEAMAAPGPEPMPERVSVWALMANAALVDALEVAAFAQMIEDDDEEVLILA